MRYYIEKERRLNIDMKLCFTTLLVTLWFVIEGYPWMITKFWFCRKKCFVLCTMILKLAQCCTLLWSLGKVYTPFRLKWICKIKFQMHAVTYFKYYVKSAEMTAHRQHDICDSIKKAMWVNKTQIWKKKDYEVFS